jgi:hypothetical protein
MFYPADWRKDTALQLCSIAARGVWLELLCVMHECTPYGHLALNGAPMPEASAARLIGVTVAEYRRAMVELERSAIFSRTDAGVLYSRRMVRDERVRLARANGGQLGAEFGHLGAEHGSKGGRPSIKKGDQKPPLHDPLKPPPSFAVAFAVTEVQKLSSTSSTRPVAPDPPEPPGFQAFWGAYPATRRRVAKAKCLVVWKRGGLEPLAVAIVEHVTAMSGTTQWRDGYEPASLTYLNQRRWEDGLPSAAVDQPLRVAM